MFWFGRKKNKTDEANEEKNPVDTSVQESDYDDLENPVSEEEILAALSENDEAEAESDDYTALVDKNDGESYTFPEDDSDGSDEEARDEVSEIQVTQLISDFDSLCEYVNKKPTGYVQYMRKDTKEVFQLREVHLRLAGVWGSVSMAREYSEKDYARIMLAIELLENPDSFYILPMFTDSEMQSAIMTFCEENFVENGKKYVKNTSKFAKFIASNDCVDEWKEYTNELMHLKLKRFCEKNGITFNNPENGDETDGDQ